MVLATTFTPKASQVLRYAELPSPSPKAPLASPTQGSQDPIHNFPTWENFSPHVLRCLALGIFRPRHQRTTNPPLVIPPNGTSQVADTKTLAWQPSHPHRKVDITTVISGRDAPEIGYSDAMKNYQSTISFAESCLPVISDTKGKRMVGIVRGALRMLLSGLRISYTHGSRLLLNTDPTILAQDLLERYTYDTFFRQQGTEAISAAIDIDVAYFNKVYGTSTTNILLFLLQRALREHLSEDGKNDVLREFGSPPGQVTTVNNILLSIQLNNRTQARDLRKILKDLPRILQRAVARFNEQFQELNTRWQELTQRQEEDPDNFPADEIVELTRLSAEREFLLPYFESLQQDAVTAAINDTPHHLACGYATVEAQDIFSAAALDHELVQARVSTTRAKAIALAKQQLHAVRKDPTAAKVVSDKMRGKQDIDPDLIFPQGRWLNTRELFNNLSRAHHDRLRAPQKANQRLNTWHYVTTVVEEMKSQNPARAFAIQKGFDDLTYYLASGNFDSIPSGLVTARTFLTRLWKHLRGDLSRDAQILFIRLGGLVNKRRLRELAGDDAYCLSQQTRQLLEDLEELDSNDDISPKHLGRLRHLIARHQRAHNFFTRASLGPDGASVPKRLLPERVLKQLRRVRDAFQARGQDVPDDLGVHVFGIEASGLKDWGREHATGRGRQIDWISDFKRLPHDALRGLRGLTFDYTAPQGDEASIHIINYNLRGERVDPEEIAAALHLQAPKNLPGTSKRTAKVKFDNQGQTQQSREPVFMVQTASQPPASLLVAPHPTNSGSYYVTNDSRGNGQGSQKGEWITLDDDDLHPLSLSVNIDGTTHQLRLQELTLRDHDSPFLAARHPNQKNTWLIISDYGISSVHKARWYNIPPSKISRSPKPVRWLRHRTPIGLRIVVGKVMDTELRNPGTKNQRLIEATDRSIEADNIAKQRIEAGDIQAVYTVPV